MIFVVVCDIDIKMELALNKYNLRFSPEKFLALVVVIKAFIKVSFLLATTISLFKVETNWFDVSENQSSAKNQPSIWRPFSFLSSTTFLFSCLSNIFRRLRIKSSRDN